MNLHQVTEQYVAFRQALGERFKAQATILRSFGRVVGAERDVADVAREQVDAFLTGNGPLTSFWHAKYIVRPVTVRFQPRLHDLRHTFAVHRLIEWYRQGADVQKLLPQLSVYLGHCCLSSTQAYLNMTPELLQQVSDMLSRRKNHDKCCITRQFELEEKRKCGVANGWAPHN